ncbi:MAG: ABC transporter substrate-binding protein [Firmicutes bacterium]|nr:ABC transporter substrate-binding protein [Bacillota bacterium]
MRKIAFLITAVFLLTMLSACSGVTPGKNEGKISITDDLGKTIVMEEPARRIISLYTAHTENLFSLGLNEEIVGVYVNESYPPEAVQKPAYDYREDPEKIIAAKPDLVLIRPFVKENAPDFVRALENAGVNVVCLYPERFEQFDDYINKLGVLTGREKEAASLLQDFHRSLKAIEDSTSVLPKKKVFFEATETEYRTITTDCMAATALRLAGGVNIASDVQPIREGSSIAPYGTEKILAHAGEIDVYIAQRGSMNAGGTPQAIKTRPGFGTIKAVKEDKVFNIDEKLISSPTFSFARGVRELARMLYPDTFDDLSRYKEQGRISRQEMAEVIVKFKHLPIFTPTSKSYQAKKESHVYGGFVDVKTGHPYFDYIETAVLTGAMKADAAVFDPEKPVTRDELAGIVCRMFDLDEGKQKIAINDLEKIQNARMAELVCQNGVMDLDARGFFRPEDPAAGSEVLDALAKAAALKQ